MAIPDTVKNDIIERVENRQARYEEFVMFPGISSGIELKNYSWRSTTQATIAVGNKVVKLREDHQLLARFLVIQQSRPQLVDKLPETIRKYEMDVTPRSPFATDGTLLILSDTSSFMKEIMQYSWQAGGEHLQIAVSGGDDSREENPEMDSQPVRPDP